MIATRRDRWGPVCAAGIRHNAERSSAQSDRWRQWATTHDQAAAGAGLFWTSWGMPRGVLVPCRAFLPPSFTVSDTDGGAYEDTTRA